MIDIAPETACVLYLAIGLMLVLGVWLATRKKEAPIFTLQSSTCEFCYHTYISDSIKTISRCPQCHLMNQK